MDASERVSRLVEALRRDGRVDVARAAAEFGTAEMTIRRDLDQLVERGVARRVRGGAVNLLMRGEELPFAMREIEAAAARSVLAVDGSKFGRAAMAVACSLSAVDVVVTDTAAPPAAVAALHAAGVQVYRA